MTARLVLPGTAGRDEWLEARRKGVTASEIAVVMGLSPWDSAFALWHRKRGDLPDVEETDVMRLGAILEPHVAERFAALHPEFAVTGDGRALYAHPGRAWEMATPDRLLSDIRFDFIDGVDETFEEYEPYAGLETKTVRSFDGWGEDGSDDVPVYYRCQVLWNADVLGLGTWYMAALNRSTGELRVYEITVDAEAQHDLEIMRDEAFQFLMRTDPPDVDWRPATTTALKRLHPDLEDREQVIPARIGRAWLAACGRVKSAEAAKRRLENQIRERLGAAARAVTRDGTKVATRQKYTVTEKKIRDPYEVDKLMPARQPKEDTQ